MTVRTTQPDLGPERLVDSIASRPGQRTRQLAKQLGVPKDGFESFVEVLFRLQAAGEVVRSPEGAWDLPERVPYRVGRLKLDRDGGAGVVRVARGSPREERIYVREDDLRDAFGGDLVVVRLTRKARGRRFAEGEVCDVVERRRKLIRAKLRSRKDGGLAQPEGADRDLGIFIPKAKQGGAKNGEAVLVRLSGGPPRGDHPLGEVVTRVGEEGSLESDLRCVRAEYDLPGPHGSEALDAAKGLPAIADGADWPERRDLRSLQTFTIDPTEARDFDDAVSLEKLESGNVRLGVHIADVSHFVEPESVLDRVAAERGTSSYLPGHVIPMLPERLANDLCSLRPHEDRLTKTVRLTYDAHGELRRTEIFHSVIRSQRRFSYGEVLTILEAPADGARGQRAKASDAGEDAAFVEPLRGMARLRDQLARKRYQRGMLYLDIPSLRLKVDEAGNTVGLTRDERDPSHSLIEEFMLEANEAVAAYFVKKKLPLVSRTHPSPTEDRLEQLRHLLAALGYRFGVKGGSQNLQRLVKRIATDPLAPVIQLGLLRTMGHAEYVLGAGLHFALATSTYCHFTSPIRRYPDLLVHQVLDDHLRGVIRRGRKETPASPRNLSEVWEENLRRGAARSSELERRAEEAEREMLKLRLIRYLEDRVGEQLNATIVAVQPFGFFVRAEETLVEGLVHVATLDSDYFEYDRERLMLYGRRGGKKFCVGDRVRVLLAEVDADHREIRFRFVKRLRGSR